MVLKRMDSKLKGVLVCMFITCWSLISLALFHRVSGVISDSKDAFSGAASMDVLPSEVVGARPVYGNYALFTSNTTEVVHAMPKTKPKNIALLLHACSHDALKFFSPSATCPRCIGLSEEMQISRILLKQNYAILAITSQDRQSKCWSNADVPRVRSALLEFQSMLPTNRTNVIAIGASSGGKFAAQLAVEGIVDAALVMVMSLGSNLRAKLVQMNNDMPPVYLAPMPRDIKMSAGARRDYQEMKRINAKVPVVFDNTTCVALSVTSEYLFQRVPGMTKTMANAIVDELIRAKHLDPITGLLIKDPTISDWRIILQNGCGSSCLENQVLEPGKSPLAKALHRAWAFHEYCSEVVDKALDFFQQTT